MTGCRQFAVATALGALALCVHAQSMSFAEVQATGAAALTGAQVKELVSGAKTEFQLVNGSLREWTNGADGTFIASRNRGEFNRRSGRGTWSVNEDGAYCLTFDWGGMETDAYCRRLYRVEDRYYAYGLDAKPATMSGRYKFSR